MTTEPARRLRLRPEDRRSRLMHAAAATFARQGFAGTRMEDVAEEAGVAKGLLYRYFPSKEDLFQSLMQELGAEFTARLKTAWANALAVDDASPWATVDAGLRVLVEEAASPDTMLNWVEPAQWELVSRFRDQTLQAVVDQLVGFAPTLAPATAWLVAAAFQGALEGAVLEWRRHGGADEEEIFQLARAFALRGLDGVTAGLGLDLPDVPPIPRIASRDDAARHAPDRVDSDSLEPAHGAHAKA